MKKILIAIPNFNNAPFIKDAIFSVLNQQLSVGFNIDVVVFDNASTDDSVNVIRTIASKYESVSLICNDINVGAIPNHNLCIEYAIEFGYDFLKILSSDDVLLPNIINRQVEILSNDDRVDIASCSMMITNEDLNSGIHYSFLKEAGKEVLRVNPETIMFKSMEKAQNLLGGPSNTMLRVIAIRDVRFQAKFSWLSDLQFAFDILKKSAGDFVYIEQPGFLYRRHSNTDTEAIARKKGLQTHEWLTFINDNRREHRFIFRRSILKVKSWFHRLRAF
ncbi:glycosyl transferase family protein [Aeromonas encheleia]|uniref:glycosyltransferase family 2 protein n=1 Tax=Aeromonas encheleia TaxID=73010 RepID=UPI000A0126FE|nr:glycosyltransferase family A protein [Aeromonas encheleia]VEG97225.1 glycosyl transferase family protein [Aeromonas encheleia]